MLSGPSSLIGKTACAQYKTGDGHDRRIYEMGCCGALAKRERCSPLPGSRRGRRSGRRQSHTRRPERHRAGREHESAGPRGRNEPRGALQSPVEGRKSHLCNGAADYTGIGDVVADYGASRESVANIRRKLAQEFSAGNPCIHTKTELIMPANYIGHRHYVYLDRRKHSDV